MSASVWSIMSQIASLAAFQPGPYLANYYATKAYVLAFSDALAHELSRFNITVTTLCPGTTKTEFHRKGRLEDTDLSRGLFNIVMDRKRSRWRATAD